MRPQVRSLSPRPYLSSKLNLLLIFLSEFKRIYKKLKASKYAIFKAILKIGIFFYIQEKLFWLLINSRKLPYFSLERISGKILYSFLEFLESQKLFISSRFIVFQKIEMRTELNLMKRNKSKLNPILFMLKRLNMTILFQIWFVKITILE